MDYQLYDTFPEDLKDEWNDLLVRSVTDTPFLRYEYLNAWWQTRGGGEWMDARLCLAVARKDGRLFGVAPLFFTPDYQGVPCLMLVGSIEVSDYLDVLAEPDDLQTFLNELMPFLAGAGFPKWKRLEWFNLQQTSPTLVALELAARPHGWSFDSRIIQPTPYITLPGDWEDYLMTVDKKQRHEIRRKLRRIESVQSVWRILGADDDLTAEMDAFMDMMAQDPDKKRFLTPLMRQHMQNTVRFAQDAGILNFSFLEIDGVKAAGKLCFDYNNQLLAYNSAVNYDFMEYSPGWVLLSKLLKWANDEAYEEFDFMRGDENYKYRFGAVDRFVMRATVNRL